VSCGVFINYRREDAGPYARLVKIRLAERFPDTPVFMDLDSIEAGVDFAEAIESAVRSCAVLIALIGRQWLTIADDEGQCRLDNPDDYVRFEIEAALERCVRVIPVLVDGAAALRQRQLPPGLCKLARLNALEMSYGRFEYDESRLLVAVEKVLASALPLVLPVVFGLAEPLPGVEQRFHRAMIAIYETAKRELGYKATRFLQMLSDQGGLATARQLLWSDTPSDGFTTLWEHRRLDLTVEDHVLRAEFASPFTDADREQALSRLKAYGWQPRTSTAYETR
jgi:TIR domain